MPLGLISPCFLVFIMVTNFVLSVRDANAISLPIDPLLTASQFGGPLAVCVFLIVLSAAGEDHLPTVWRVCFGIGILLPLTVFFFRLRMLSSKLFKKGAIKSENLTTYRYGSTCSQTT